MLHARKDYQRIQDPTGKIPADEPVFLLRAQDKTAANVVDFWANANEMIGGDPAAIALARAHVKRMQEWPVKKVCDVPDEAL
jgi:hypothetical protein